MRSFASKVASIAAVSASLVFGGCRYVHVEKHGDGSWEAKYYSYGLWSTLGKLDVVVGTNGIAKLTLNDVNSDVSTNHVRIVDAAGSVVAEITGAIVEAVVREPSESVREIKKD